MTLFYVRLLANLSKPHPAAAVYIRDCLTLLLLLLAAAVERVGAKNAVVKPTTTSRLLAMMVLYHVIREVIDPLVAYCYHQTV